MAWTKCKLGDYITRVDIRNYDNIISNVMGISVRKEFRVPTSKVNRNELSTYKIVEPGQFAFVQTTHNEKCFAFAYNDTQEKIVVSSVNEVFFVNEEYVLARYLQMFLNRPSFDRYARYNSWGSAREVFSWDDLCDVEICLPSIAVQQKYVDVYKAMVENQQSYERGLEDLKLVCDGYIEDLRRNVSCEKIGPYIEELKSKNIDYSIDKNMAVSTEKVFIPSHADLNGVDIGNYLICKKGHFAYNTVTTKNGNKISIAYNKDEDCLVSPIYTVFKVDYEILFPEYLMLWFNRKEFDRYARYNSWGSAREMFTFDEMKLVEIPIPDIEVQKSIADIYNIYIKRKEINEQLKTQIKNICPILIKGSLEEGR